MSLIIYSATSALIFGCTSYISFKTDKYDACLCFGALSAVGIILIVVQP